MTTDPAALASALTAYRQAAYAHAASTYELTRLCDEADEGDGDYSEADEYRHYGHADATDALAAAATALLDLAGFTVSLPDFSTLPREGDTVRAQTHAGLWTVSTRYTDGTALLKPLDDDARACLDGTPWITIPLTDLTIVTSTSPASSGSAGSSGSANDDGGDNQYGWNDPAVRAAVREAINQREV